MPFEVFRHRDKGKSRTTWVVVRCLATRADQDTVCQCRHLYKQADQVLKFHFNSLKSKIPELLSFFERHRSTHDPSPCDLLLQLFPVQHQMLNRALLGLAQRELIKAARGQS